MARTRGASKAQALKAATWRCARYLRAGGMQRTPFAIRGCISNELAITGHGQLVTDAEIGRAANMPAIRSAAKQAARAEAQRHARAAGLAGRRRKRRR